MVWIHSSPFLMEILLIFETPSFSRADAISSSVANTNSLLLISRLGVLNFSCGYALNFVVWKVFIFNVFSVCLRLSTSTSNLIFLVFFTVFGIALVEITFSMSKGENLAKQTSSKDSITMNLEKFIASFSESGSDRFRLFFFYLKMPYMLFFAGPVHHHPPWSPTCVGNEPRGKTICFGWDRDTRLVYLTWG